MRTRREFLRHTSGIAAMSSAVLAQQNSAKRSPISTRDYLSDVLYTRQEVED